jgi:beta-glucosidase
MKTFQFPKDFLWGTATSGHQIEGDNKNSDWWAWENRDRSKDSWLLKMTGRTKLPLEPSLKASDSYKRYMEDLQLAQALNNNAIRFGVEWARLEPQEGHFEEKEFEHYKEIMRAARQKGLKTFVTLHHFSNPLWFAQKGGWVALRSRKYFARYAKKCAEEFGDLVDVYLTINEPQVYALISFLAGRWVPQATNPIKADMVMTNMIRAHNYAYKEIKSVGDFKVGLVKHIVWYETSPESKNPLDLLYVRLLNYLNSDYFLKPISKNLDLIGLNYYFTSWIKNLKRAHGLNDWVSDMGWWLETKGLKNILLTLKKYNLPLYITENGLADAKDKYRTRYINEVLWQCAEALKAGVDLRGYFHWSLLDNYEWSEGFWPRFGLVEVDRENNLQRKPRPSFYQYAKICKSGTISK